jgi:maltose alpha-D-glucosyltransferase/alpha-amylase
MSFYWYKNAVFYSLDIETFYDSDGDGHGDLKGLIARLDYIASLGINCIWLQPFFPSPDRDNRYDVMDYYSVDPRLGTLGDFAEFMDKADHYGIRVIIDLVVNHTSKHHPWFQEARKDKTSRYRNYYVWSDKPLPFDPKHLVLKGEEHTVWTFDEEAGQYYLHHFYEEQPDLNLLNPDVREEVLHIMGFWLRLGVAGFRVDGVKYLVDGYAKEPDPKLHLEYLKEMREFVAVRKSEAILLGETNLEPEELMTYVNAEDGMHMGYNFYVNQYLFLSLAKEEAAPLQKALKAMPYLTPSSQNQMLSFLRHHDELTLKLLKKKEYQLVFKRFAPDENMQIYVSGIRRRLVPMLNGDRKLLELAYSLMFSLPGTPLIRFGEELGMGDNLALEGRNAVRTPMQWSDDKHGGFTTNDDHTPVHPVIKNGPYGYRKVNMYKAQREPKSLLNWLQRLIVIRKRCPTIGLGKLEIIPTKHPSLLIHAMQWKGERLLFLHNFSAKKIKIAKTEFSDPDTHWVPLFYGAKTRHSRDGGILLDGHDYEWLRADFQD